MHTGFGAGANGTCGIFPLMELGQNRNDIYASYLHGSEEKMVMPENGIVRTCDEQVKDVE